MKNIALMGSTGSIGTQTLDIVRRNADLKICGLSAGRNKDLLEKQAREFRPSFIVIEKEEDASDLRIRLADTGIKVASGMTGLTELAAMEESDIFVTAIVGMIGIRPTLAAIEAGKDIALANKETLVTAGHLIMPLVKEKGVKLLPVDSEHSAIFQCLKGAVKDENDKYPIYKIWLTASGGAFRGRTKEELINVTAADALKHPNWNMGNKVTIDSATLVNKGLEVMEAKWLFNVDVDDINVIIQPKSIIHSMVEFNDGSVIAQIGAPDMRVPIQYALVDPERNDCEAKRLDFYELGRIVFERPDTEVFRGLPLAVSASKAGGTMPVVFNAANEVAVEEFLKGRIGFFDIYEMIEKAMASHKIIDDPSLEDILSAEAETRSNTGF